MKNVISMHSRSTESQFYTKMSSEAINSIVTGTRLPGKLYSLISKPENYVFVLKTLNGRFYTQDN